MYFNGIPGVLESFFYGGEYEKWLSKFEVDRSKIEFNQFTNITILRFQLWAEEEICKCIDNSVKIVQISFLETYLFIFFSFYSASSILRFQFRSRYIYVVKKMVNLRIVVWVEICKFGKMCNFFFLTLNNFLSIHFIWKVAQSGIPAPRKRYLLLLHYVGNSIESKRDISFYSAR